MDQQAKPVPSKSRSKGKRRKPAAAPKHQAPLDGGAAMSHQAPSASGLDRSAPARHREDPGSDSESDASSILSERSGAAPPPKDIANHHLDAAGG